MIDVERDGYFRQFEAEALIDRDVRVLAGFQIAGQMRFIHGGETIAHDDAAIAFALKFRIGADGL